MAWEPRQAPAEWDGIVVFDGACAFCTAGMGFIDRYDRAGRFRFAPIRSAAGQALALRFGVTPEAPQTNIVILGGRAHFKADAVFAVLAALPTWRWAAAPRVLPRPVRDWLYDLMARNRLALTRFCAAPSARFRARVLEHLEGAA